MRRITTTMHTPMNDRVTLCAPCVDISAAGDVWDDQQSHNRTTGVEHDRACWRNVDRGTMRTEMGFIQLLQNGVIIQFGFEAN